MKIYIVLKETGCGQDRFTSPECAFRNFGAGCKFIDIMKVHYPDAQWRIEPVELVGPDQPAVIAVPDDMELKPTWEFLLPHEEKEEESPSVKLGRGVRWGEE